MKRALCFWAFMFLSVSLTYSQEQNFSYSDVVYSRLKSSIPNLRNEIRPILTSEEQEILDEIRIDASRSGYVNAFAAIDDQGQRRITIFTGMAMMIEFNSIAIVASTKSPECATEYIRYQYEMYFENTKRKALGLALTEVLLPASFWRGSQDCVALSQWVLAPSPDEANMYSEFVNASLQFLFLHEVAHHVLGHTGISNFSDSESRLNEDDADAWALKNTLRLSYNPGALTSIFFHFAITGGAAIEDEQHNSHPLGARRMLRWIDRTLQQEEDEELRELIFKVRTMYEAIFRSVIDNF